jgi:hypothetical protein
MDYVPMSSTVALHYLFMLPASYAIRSAAGCDVSGCWLCYSVEEPPHDENNPSLFTP